MNTLGTLEYGLGALQSERATQDRRANWAKGEHPILPYAPEGVVQEYLELREQSKLPLIKLAVKLPCQRLRLESVSLVGKGDSDRDVLDTWAMWTGNGMNARQRAPFRDGLVHDRGIVGVWRNDKNPDVPVIRPESPLNVHVEPSPEDPFSAAWAVKTWQATPDVTQPTTKVSYGVLYTAERVYRYKRTGTSRWELEREFPNPLGAVPFVTFVPELDAEAGGVNHIDSLVPMQRNIDTMRFFLNLAANYAAYRQRVATGYDPVVRDESGNPVYVKDDQGNVVLGEDGLPRVQVRSPGRAGVDRLLVFPGPETKIFDLQESDLNNYVAALNMLYATFAAAGQVPSQYLVGDFKNVSGDLLTATESGLLSFIGDLQASYGESAKHVLNLANVSRGRPDLRVSEVTWADASPVSLSMLGDFASKAIPNGWPLEDIMQRAPGMTPQRIADLLATANNALQRVVSNDLASVLSGPKPDVATV